MRKLLLGILFGFFIQSLFAQRDVDDGSSWADRIYVGGGGGLNAGTNNQGDKYFSFSINPVIGYMITPRFSMGSAFSYQKVSFTDRGFDYTQYAIMPFARYNFNELFLTSEFDYINLPILKYSNGGYTESTRIFKSRLLFGAGYTQKLGDRLSVNVMAMYDVLYSRPSVFYSPWVFRVFFSF